jgi:circadian clock protein KaiC
MGDIAPLEADESGVAGLDDVLGGGFTPRRLFLIEGVPGSGKTTLAMQFLMSGVRQRQPVLLVTLSETQQEIADTAASHGWSLDGITVHEVVPSESSLQTDDQYTMFHPAEVELSQTIRSLLDQVDQLKPRRVVFDSLSELRLLAGSPLRYRRQILALKQYFAGRNCTVLLLDDMTTADRDLQVQSISHGVVLLEQLQPEYGSDRRRLRVVKYRGRQYRGGYHDYKIERGGLTVYPRLVAAEHRGAADRIRHPSGVSELDALLGGGIESGTSTLIVGAPGAGKSSLTAQFAYTGVGRGQRTSMFLFDESVKTFLMRAEALNMPLRQYVDSGQVAIIPIDPAELSPGEFCDRIRVAVDENNANIVVVDSLNGYLNAMPGERFLVNQLHELFMYLGQRNVATLLTAAQQGLIGMQMTSPVDATYLADAVILLRYFEAAGEVRKAISVVKKRGGFHERTIREFRLDRGRVEVGPPLHNFHGVLSGIPTMQKPLERDQAQQREASSDAD